jgi:tRNA pseudouridine55 synthase
MNGFLNLLKPPGMTSHDVVSYVRRTLHTRAVGHTGTLDPAAAGVLVLTVGDYTRLGEYLLEGDKSYRAQITLGLTTDSADAEGTITAQASAAHITEVQVRSAVETLTGTIAMRPPAHSAVRVGGKRLYELARRGETVEAPERTVEVNAFTLLQLTAGERASLLADVTCSKGTYVRSLAQMLGDALGCGGYLSMLIRTRVGVHELAQATTLEELAENPSGGLQSARQALPHLREAVVDAAQEDVLRHGQATPSNESLPAGPVLVYNARGQLVCLAEVNVTEETWLQPRKVFSS